MSEFHNVVDVDEHGILNNLSKDEGIDMVDDELEVITTDDYQFAGFHEDDRKRLLKELSKSSTCSHGEVHVKPFQIGQVFKTKLDVKNYMNSHDVATRRSLYQAKNDKIWIRVKCKGVVRLRSVHEVISIASFPHLQVTIFESEAIGCREGCNGRATVESRRDDD
ncbi:unnamed protein product [Lactuca saligna]|uniref:Transposase MuDR plant domain-containing protein n=1 Tax=Lactuca saligna TaxID=75948 RepID=A0AA35Z4N1_LACSI|nr:unnamed protein product [Lactuca saligna]